MGDLDDDEEYQARMMRRMPWQAPAGVLVLLAIGVFAGVGLRGWTLAVPMLIVAVALFAWSLRL